MKETKYVYVLHCAELLDNGDFTPVLYGVFNTREMAEEFGNKYCGENEYLIGFDVIECELEGFECKCKT